MKALDLYAEVYRELRGYQAQNAQVFDGLLAIEERLRLAEAAVKKEAIVNLSVGVTSHENDIAVVTVSQPLRRFYDYGVIEQLATPKEKKALVEALDVSIDPDKLKQLVLDEKVSVKLERESYREVKLAPRVAIKLKETK